MNKKIIKKTTLYRIVFSRVLAIILVAVFLLSTFMTGSYAWSSMSQTALNEVQGEGTEQVQLQKYEKFADGTATTIPVAGAEFYLFKVAEPDDIQIGGAYLTDENGNINVNLRQGDYYFIETNPGYGFTYDQDAEGGEIKQYPFTIAGNETEPVAVTAYNRHVEGSLIITKEVKNEDENVLTAEQLATGFEFTVTFSDGGTYAYKLNGGGADIPLVSGERISLKHGETAVFEHIPVGVGYTVTETPAAGYSITSNNSSGDIVEEDTTASFINTYTPDGYGSLIVTKEVINADGSALTAAQQYLEFEFTASIGGQTETFTLKNGEMKTFENIPLGTAYTVTETDDLTDDYMPAIKEYSGTISMEEQVITLPMVNVYNSPDADGSLSINKTVTGEDVNETQEFTFRLTFAGENLPDPIQYRIDGGPLKELGSDGKIVLTHEQTAVFEDLPDGTAYTVTEEAIEDYTAAISSGSGIIAGDITAKVGIINNQIPAPAETAIVIEKIGAGDGFDPEKEFIFTVYINGTALPDKVILKAGETSDPIMLNVGDSYEVVEEQETDEEYIRTGLVNGSGIAALDPITVVQTNTYTGSVEIAIDGEKTWDKQGNEVELPSSITVYLKNGTYIAGTATVTPDADGKWFYHFKAPKYDEQGNEIAYTVEEAAIIGWEPETDGYNINNTYITPVTDNVITVEKKIEGNPEEAEEFRFVLAAQEGAPMPEASYDGVQTITVTGAGSDSFGGITYTEEGTYTYTIAELNDGANGYTYDETIYTYQVAVELQGSELAIVSRTLSKNGESAGKVLFTNAYDKDKISVKVSKIWKDSDDAGRPERIQIQLFQDGEAYGTPLDLNEGNRWKHTFTGLNKDSVWTVDEVSVPDGYMKTIAGDVLNGFTITNTKESGENQTSVSVRKVWDDDNNPNRPENVQIQLYKDDVVYGSPITLNIGNDWTYTWNGLDQTSRWTVKEIDIPNGYAVEVTGNAKDGFTVTNTTGRVPSDESVIISGKKIWYQGNNPQEKWPDSIILYVRADGEIVVQEEINESDDFWSWNIRLPKYAEDGHEIVYTVDEAPMDDYSKKVDGYDITNTYKPGGNTDGPGDGTSTSSSGSSGRHSSAAKTGDNSLPSLWIVLMILSFTGLAVIGTIKAVRQKREGKK